MIVHTCIIHGFNYNCCQMFILEKRLPLDFFEWNPGVKYLENQRSLVTRMTSSAPHSRALSVLFLIISVITIFDAPIVFAAKSETNPIGPQPVIRTVFPSVIPARRHAWIPTDKGSIKAASSYVMLSGILNILIRVIIIPVKMQVETTHTYSQGILGMIGKSIYIFLSSKI